MSTTTSRQPLHILRHVLRRLKTPPLSKELLTRSTNKQPIAAQQTIKRLNPSQTYVLQQYRRQQSLGPDAVSTSSAVIRQLQLQLFHNYQQLLDGLAERARLYDLDTGADQVLTPAELSRRAAARAGLQLPQPFKGLDDNDDEFSSSTGTPRVTGS